LKGLLEAAAKSDARSEVKLREMRAKVSEEMARLDLEQSKMKEASAELCELKRGLREKEL
jgi:hypothetical protein